MGTPLPIGGASIRFRPASLRRNCRGSLTLPFLIFLGPTPLPPSSAFPSIVGAAGSVRRLRSVSGGGGSVFGVPAAAMPLWSRSTPRSPDPASSANSARTRMSGGGKGGSGSVSSFGSSSPAGKRGGSALSSTPSEDRQERGYRNPTLWSDAASDAYARCIPPLTSSSHKGSSGRVGVLGGSARYTGAPYYAAMGALKVGADLAFVFTAEEAAIPIKCYSPELMVASVYSAREFDGSLERLEEARRKRLDESGDGDWEVDEEVKRIEEEQERLVNKMVAEVTSLFDRMHVLIVGPGLGRCPLVLRAAARIISDARECNLPLVIDADGLYLLTLEEYADLISGCRGLVLTPNAVEVKRLAQKLGANYAKIHVEEREVKDMDGEELCLTAFDRATEGCVVVKKGQHDILFSVTRDADPHDGRVTVSRGSMLCEEEGGMKRSGGLGDILSGAVGTFVAWNRILSRERDGVDVMHEDTLLACWSACCVTKRATRTAYQKRRRAMTAPDVLEEIGGAVDDMMSEAEEQQRLSLEK